jgi:hypothetical protein
MRRYGLPLFRPVLTEPLFELGIVHGVHDQGCFIGVVAIRNREPLFGTEHEGILLSVQKVEGS